MPDDVRVLLAMDASTAYTRGVLRGVLRQARTIGRWRVAVTGWREATLKDIGEFDGAIGWFVRGEDQRAVLASTVPAVNTSSEATHAGLPSVLPDEDGIGRFAAEHLTGLGLRHFAYVGVPNDVRTRGEAFARALHAPCATLVLDAWPAEQWRLLTDWLAGLPKPVGILARNDQIGRRVLAACERAAVAVPEQAAVLAVDDDELVCEASLPPLSSVAVPAERIGREAVDLLAALIAGRPAPAAPVLIPPSGVVPRQSSDLLASPDPEINAALRHIHAHATTGLGVPDLLAAVPLSRRTLEIRFQRVIGRSPAAEIRRVRLVAVKRQLADSDRLIRDIAADCGFTSAKQLCETFLNVTGMTPGEYRRKHRAR